MAGKISFRRAKLADMEAIATNVREMDRLEIELVTGKSPRSALTMAYVLSSEPGVALMDDEPFAVFGCATSEHGHAPWMIGTDKLVSYAGKRALVSYAQYVIDRWRADHGELRNFVLEDNLAHVAFLKRLGAKTGRRVTIKGRPFLEFIFDAHKGDALHLMA